MVRRAQCQCGGFTATAATEPGVVMACHCTWCQRRLRGQIKTIARGDFCANSNGERAKCAIQNSCQNL